MRLPALVLALVAGCSPPAPRPAAPAVAPPPAPASSPDAAPPDAAPPDAVPPDAVPPDAVPPDAAPDAAAVAPSLVPGGSCTADDECTLIPVRCGTCPPCRNEPVRAESLTKAAAVEEACARKRAAATVDCSACRPDLPDAEQGIRALCERGRCRIAPALPPGVDCARDADCTLSRYRCGNCRPCAAIPPAAVGKARLAREKRDCMEALKRGEARACEPCPPGQPAVDSAERAVCRAGRCEGEP